jgi:hypothetical protein
MTFIKHRRVSCTRASRYCQWCYESIDVGQPMDVQSYYDDHGEFCEDRYHPECWAAFDTLPVEEQESWSPGDFLRGCTCEAGTQCKCKQKEPQQ